jgi:hypothetical protein
MHMSIDVTTVIFCNQILLPDLLCQVKIVIEFSGAFMVEQLATEVS